MYILYCVQGFGLVCFFPFKFTFLKQHVLNTLNFQLQLVLVFVLAARKVSNTFSKLKLF